MSSEFEKMYQKINELLQLYSIFKAILHTYLFITISGHNTSPENQIGSATSMSVWLLLNIYQQYKCFNKSINLLKLGFKILKDVSKHFYYLLSNNRIEIACRRPNLAFQTSPVAQNCNQNTICIKMAPETQKPESPSKT